MEIRLKFRNRLLIVITEGGTQEARRTGCWMSWAKLVGGRGRKIRSSIQRREAMGRPSGRKLADATLPRKSPKEING
jgi:hypothetical protein